MAVTTTLKTLREAVAGQLGLLMNVTIDTDADPIFTINDLLDKSPDAERLRDAYLYQSGVARRISSIDVTGALVTVTRISAITTGASQIYSMLDPEDMNAAINEALQELYFIERESIALVANTYIYTLPTWVQQKGQILNIKWRDTSVLTTRPLEVEVSSYRIIEDANACQVFLSDALRSVTTYDLMVYGRKNYSTMASDASTTTCPYPLIFSVAMVKIIHRLFNKYGKGIASLYGPKMVVAEGEMAKNKADWLPKLVAREYVEEENWEGIDSNQYFDSPVW